MTEETKIKISLAIVKQPFWAMSSDETLSVLRSKPEGLSAEEVKARVAVFGQNQIREKRRLTKIKMVSKQLRSPLILVLIAAGFVTLLLRENANTLVIFLAVAANTVLGFWQENKAENALALLKTYIRTRARVRRSGRELEIDAVELVPGDIIRITQGDRIPTDGRLVFSSNLEVDESVLTGESLPVDKSSALVPAGTALPNRTSVVFGGTLVTQGFGDVVVTATGNNTEFGRIASLVGEKSPEPTPLQRAIARFTKISGMMLGVLVCLLFLVGLWYGYGIFEMFLVAVAVAVSAVPEGLPIALTVILAAGVERLAKKRGVVRRLLAAETLGSTSLILTDKTGTLTQAKMELYDVIPELGGANSVKKVLEYALINTDVVIENSEEKANSWRIFGRPVEIALVRGAAARGLLLPLARKEVLILDRSPFNSTQKFSASIVERGRSRESVYLGAPEILVENSVLSPDKKEKIKSTIDAHAFAGEKVLGVASKKVEGDHKKFSRQHELHDVQFMGLVTFRDPVRPRVSEAIRRIASAGIRTIIVTGDHRGTAEAVGRELGMVDGKGAVLTGDDLNYLKREEILARSDEVTIFARLTPEQKVMLTKLYKEKGEVVAVTGDGVNDAPALLEADIGVAVGSGTDVAKSAADLVVLDDNFETIVVAIEEGRKVLDNIRKVIVYLLSDAFDELLLIGGALFTGIALPLNALQILFVNFFSDSFPAVAFAFEDGADTLGEKPRKLDKNLFNREMRFMILVIGFLTSALLFAIYFYMLRFGLPPELVRTFIFATFATYSLLLAFSLRSLSKSVVSYNPFSNPYLVAGVSIGIVFTLLAVYVPSLQSIFGTISLPPLWLLGVLGVGLLNISIVEFGKWIFRRPDFGPLAKGLKLISGVALTIFGLVALVIPFFPFAWVGLVGLELLGVRKPLWNRIKTWLPGKKEPNQQ